MRKTSYDRYTLSRREETRESAFGPVRVKVSSGYGVQKEKAEYDDLSRLAKENGVSVSEVRRSIK